MNYINKNSRPCTFRLEPRPSFLVQSGDIKLIDTVDLEDPAANKARKEAELAAATAEQ